MTILEGPAFAQFSPGPLSKAHQQIGGPTRCSACHALAGGKRQFRCLGCHTEIRRRLEANRGWHPALLGGNRGQEACIKCHSEHNGEEFVPIRWDIDKREFDHTKAGYPLEGAHRGLACEKCHTPQHIRAAERKAIRVSDLRRTYLGLSPECSSCHADPHAGQLGPQCERCHRTTRWNDVTRFDHGSAKFKLAGAHERVACAKCHKPVTKARMQFVGLAFQQCSGCHQDPHRGAFAASCQSCHSEAVWKPARVAASGFDHSKTRFALLGKHAIAGCDKCHRGANFKEPVAHEKCGDCHRDAHGGQLLARADRGECGSCHTVEGWKPATLTVAQHSVYPLEGRHASVDCAKCHVPKGTATLYRVRRENCADCHADTHKGQLSAYGNRCEECHSVQGFRPSRFTLARHQQTRFRLAGAHAAVPCAECHQSGTGRFQFADQSCAGCHTDPHSGRFRKWMSAGAGGCQACHTTGTWRDVARFDHEKTAFPLAGAHRGVACGQCHRATDYAATMRPVFSRPAPQSCGGCHEDAHGGQFPPDCRSCHGLDRWTPSKFDHQKTAFRLTGAHLEAACRRCHTSTRKVSGRTVLFYNSTPSACTGCHGPQTTE